MALVDVMPKELPRQTLGTVELEFPRVRSCGPPIRVRITYRVEVPPIMVASARRMAQEFEFDQISHSRLNKQT